MAIFSMPIHYVLTLYYIVTFIFLLHYTYFLYAFEQISKTCKIYGEIF